MRLYLKSLALLPAILVVVGAFTAQAAKPVRPRLLQSRTPYSMGQPRFPVVQATACTLGSPGAVSTVVDYIIPPDDAFYNLFQLQDCLDCQFTDSAIVRRVHVVVEWDVACSIAVDVYFVGVTGPDSCPYPDVTRILSPPQRFVLTAPFGGEPIEYELTLPESALVFQRNFLVVSFPDTMPGCGLPGFKPVLPFVEGCRPCLSWNQIDVDEALDDLCGVDPQVGNPIMWAVVDTCFPHRDPSPPSRITDFAADSIRSNGIGFSWTAPGDNAAVGTASSYDLRRSTSPIDSLNVGAATPMTGLPAPLVSGTQQSFFATGLPEATRFFFAIRGRDETGNIGKLSNVLDETTGVAPPGAVGDLSRISTTENSVRLRWTATGDDGGVGRPLRYLVAAATQPVTDVVFASARKESLTATVDAGGTENFNFPGLARATTHYFAVKARDDVGGLGPVSNGVSGRTEVGGPLIGRAGPAVSSLSQPERLPVEIFWVGVAPGTPQTIKLYDLSGRVVRTLDLGTDPSGVSIWNGKNDGGEDMPSGVYIARLVTGSARATARIVLLK